MQRDENDLFDESVDPYDREIDFEYDDGIPENPDDDIEDEDEDDWDVSYDDDQTVFAQQSDEMTDYDEIDD